MIHPLKTPQRNSSKSCKFSTNFCFQAFPFPLHRRRHQQLYKSQTLFKEFKKLIKRFENFFLLILISLKKRKKSTSKVLFTIHRQDRRKENKKKMLKKSCSDKTFSLNNFSFIVRFFFILKNKEKRKIFISSDESPKAIISAIDFRNKNLKVFTFW